MTAWMGCSLAPVARSVQWTTASSLVTVTATVTQTRPVVVATTGTEWRRRVLNPESVDTALRSLIGWLDYDLHKSLECDESTGEDTYHEEVVRFIEAYNEAEGK
jgi:hypothetical protein